MPPSEAYPIHRLGDVGVAVLDCHHLTPKSAASGYPYVAIPNLKDGRVDLRGVRLIGEAEFRLWTNKTKPVAGDVIVTRRGRVGDTAVVPAGLECALGQDLVILRSDGELVDQDYLRWASRGPLWATEVDRYHNVGAVFQSLNVSDIPKLEIHVPPLKAQRTIAATLSALDDKIELNRRMNATLSRIIDELFTEFCDRKAQQDATTTTVAGLAQYVNGRNFTKGASGTGRMVIRIAELNSGPGPATVYSDVDAPAEHVAAFGDILFSWSGSLSIHRWYGPGALINQHIFKVIPNSYPTWFVHRHLLRALGFFRDIAADKATTMGHIKRGHLSEASVAIPHPSVLQEASRLIAPLDQRVAANMRETHTLVNLRDFLLPKLMSGAVQAVEAPETADIVESTDRQPGSSPEDVGAGKGSMGLPAR